jgi:uncharacterized GH25 family protein
MRKRWIGILTGMAAMLMLAAGYQVSQAQPAQTGKITVKVLKDNQPVPNVTVRLFADSDKNADSAHDAAPQAADSNKPHHGKHKESQALMKGTTSADGTFTFNKVAAGHYVVRAGSKDEGMAMEHVTVTADQTAEVTLNLKMHGDKDHK